MLRKMAITSLIFAGAATVAYADVFRWVDEHGGVHYSDQWVPGSEVIKTTRPHPPVGASDTGHSTGQKLAASNDHVADKLSQQNASQAVKQDVAKAHDAQCKEAKDRYDKAVQARRFYKPPAKDADKAKTANADQPEDRQYLSEEEADAYRVKARTEMQEACGPAAK